MRIIKTSTLISCIYLVFFLVLDVFSNITTIYLQEKAGKISTNYPLTFGHVFKKGDVTENVKITQKGSVLPSQTDVKVRHLDGSIKFAILSVLFPTVNKNELITLSFNQAQKDKPVAITKESILSTDFETKVIFVINSVKKSISARDLLSRTENPQVWLNGSIVKEFLVEGIPRTENGNPDNSLVVKFNIRAYKGLDKIRVSVIVENSRGNRMGGLKYGVTIMSDKEVYTNDNVSHNMNSRWRKIFWYGGKPSETELRFNVPYMISTGTIPNFDLNLKIPEKNLESKYSAWKDSEHDIMQSGVIKKYFPTTGGRDDIGLLPAWTVRYIYTMKNREKEVMLNLGELSGSIPIHFREPDPNRKFFEKIISIDDRPTIRFNDWNYKYTKENDKLTPISDDKGGWTVDRAHQPNLVFFPYIVTGDKYFLDEIYFWAAYNLGCETFGRKGTKNLTPDMTGTLSDGIISSQIRSDAWTIRNVAYAAIFGEDGDIEKEYFLRKVFNNLVQWASYKDKYPLKFWKVNVYSYPKSSDWKVALKHTNAPWENDYMINVLLHLNDLGMNTEPILNWFSQFIINRFSHPEFNWFNGASFQFPAVTADGEYIKTWKQAKECYLDQPDVFTHDDYPTSYRYIARAALSCLVDYPNGRKAYEFLDTHIHNKEKLRENPKWAFLPRNESSNNKYGKKAIISAISSEPVLKILQNSSKNVKIQYSVKRYEHIKIEIFDSKGKLVETLIDSQHQRGSYIYNWSTEKYRNGIFHIKYFIGKDTIVKNSVIVK